MKYILMAAAGLLSGFVGSMGLGGGGFLIIYLTVFQNVPQVKAQGINLLFFIPIALFSTVKYFLNKEIDFKTVLFAALGGVPGTVAGTLLLKVIGATLLSKIFGASLILLGIYTVFSAKSNNPHGNKSSFKGRQ